MNVAVKRERKDLTLEQFRDLESEKPLENFSICTRVSHSGKVICQINLLNGALLKLANKVARVSHREGRAYVGVISCALSFTPTVAS